MPDYKTMYYHLFNAITDAITILQQSQQKTEDLYLEAVVDDELPRDISVKENSIKGSRGMEETEIQNTGEKFFQNIGNKMEPAPSEQVHGTAGAKNT